MDIALFKTSWAGLLGTMLQIDPATGLPYAAPPSMVGSLVRANAQAPVSMAETDLPQWVLFTGQAKYPDPPDRSLNRLAKETREFTASLFVCVAQAGGSGEAERRVQPYVNAARDLLQKHPRLWDGNSLHNVPGILRTWIIRDTGITELRYGRSNPNRYLGLSFTVKVEALNEVAYASE